MDAADSAAEAILSLEKAKSSTIPRLIGSKKIFLGPQRAFISTPVGPLFFKKLTKDNNLNLSLPPHKGSRNKRVQNSLSCKLSPVG
ncbi:MAG: hypothetical protein LBT47_13510 [Deltaproteobacteria bacterium]|nr:hypothetical protein [Deltaproteobacteria bacterium]